MHATATTAGTVFRARAKAPQRRGETPDQQEAEQAQEKEAPEPQRGGHQGGWLLPRRAVASWPAEAGLRDAAEARAKVAYIQEE